MKPLILVTLIISGLAETAGAQVQATATLAATVEQDLQLTSTGETNFGRIGNFAHTETIDPTAPTADQTTAQFSATSSNAVVYTCPTEVRLTGPGASSMTFTTRMSSHTAADRQATSGLNSCAEAFLINEPTVFFWLGGDLKVLSNQEPGSYSGVFTLSATYQ